MKGNEGKMLEDLKKKAYYANLNMMFSKGVKEGKIKAFDDELYSKMNNFYFFGIPISMYIKYLKPLKGMPGKCYDRSLLMFFCFDNAQLVRGNNKELMLRYGQDRGGHGWIEIENYVYDPSLLMKIDKDLYYKMFEPTNISKCDIEQYKKIENNLELYNKIRNTKIEDYMPGGDKRTDLLMYIPLVRGIAEVDSNKQFLPELDNYLNQIQYDEGKIYEEFDIKFKKAMNKDQERE